MRNQRREMVCEQRPLVFKKTQQVGHLFEVGRHVRVVPAQMDIIELNEDDMLDAVFEATPILGRRPFWRSAELAGGLSDIASAAAAAKKANAFITGLPPTVFAMRRLGPSRGEIKCRLLPIRVTDVAVTLPPRPSRNSPAAAVGKHNGIFPIRSFRTEGDQPTIS
jgi:hypothetical protein